MRLLIESCEEDYRTALVTAVNKYGNTALDVALAAGHSDCAHVLSEHPLGEKGKKKNSIEH